MGIHITNRGKYGAYVLLLLAVMALPASFGGIVHAGEPSPKPKPKESALDNLKQKMRDKRERKQELAEKMQKLEAKLGSLRTKLVETGEAVQEQEEKLGQIEQRLGDLRKRRDKLETKLHEDRKRLAKLVLALQRMQRIPPSAMMARPGSPLKTAQSALLLETSLSGVHARARKLRDRMAKLEKLENEILTKKRDLRETTQKLQAKQRTMRTLMAQRRSMYAHTRRQHKQEEQELRNIAERAETMKQLIDRLAEKNRKQRQRQDKQDKSRKNSDSSSGLRPGDTYMPGTDKAMRNPGETRLPAAGEIDVNYGQENYMGAKSKGLYIQSRPGALIVAPISGVVRYKGPFKNYGKLIIIEHNKNYHSLIAGFDKIDTVVGRKVVAGEPIGRMAEGDDAKHQLYYELRHNGNPVNPERRIAEL